MKFVKESTFPILEWSGKEGGLLENQTLDIVFTDAWTNGEIEICASGEIEPTSSMIRVLGKEVETERTWGTEVWCERFDFDELKKGDRVQVQNDQNMELVLHRIRVNKTNLLEPSTRLAVKPEITVLKDGGNAEKSIFERKEIPPWLEPYKEMNPSLQVGRLSLYSEINDLNVMKKNIPEECAPLEAFYKGVSQASTKKSCKVTFNNPELGDNCFVGIWWVSVGRENIDWSQLFVALKKDRLCQHEDQKYWWVYPNDSIQWSFDSIKEDYSLLRIIGTTFGEGQWRIQLRNENTIFLDKIVDEIDPTGEIILDIPIRHKVDPNIIVEITALEGTANYLFVEYIELDN